MIHHPKTFLAVGLLLLLGTAPGASEQQKEGAGKKGPNYFPLQVGNTWQYELTANGNKGTMVNKIARTETVNGVERAVLETSVMGKVVNSEHLRQTEQGVFRYRNNNDELMPPLPLLKYPVKAGDKWDGEMTANNQKVKYTAEVGEETIQLPAGQFKTVRVAIRADIQGQQLTTTYWFAQDVGLVKQTAQLGTVNMSMELEKFERAK
jgi:hypothetical protein